jgi:uncharacterized protein with GYD domain
VVSVASMKKSLWQNSTRLVTAFHVSLGMLLASLLAASSLRAQESKPTASPAPSSSLALDSKAILLTVFFRHDQTKTLDEIQSHLKTTGFDKTFPPAGVEVVSYYVMMGIGQVMVLRVPPDKLREVNVAIERGAWGAYRTEFYPTYDYKPIWEAARAKAAAAESTSGAAK